MNVDRERKPAQLNYAFWEHEYNQNFSDDRKRELLVHTWIKIHDRFSFRVGDILVQADGDEIILAIENGWVHTGMIGFKDEPKGNGDINREVTIEAHSYRRVELFELCRRGQMMVICPERGNYNACYR